MSHVKKKKSPSWAFSTRARAASLFATCEKKQTTHSWGELRLPNHAVARSATFGKFEIKIRMIWSMSPRHKLQKPNCHKRFAHSAARRTRNSNQVFEESCRVEVRRAFGFSPRTVSQSEHQVDLRKSLIIETEIRKSVRYSPMALQGVDRAFQRPSRRAVAQKHRKRVTRVAGVVRRWNIRRRHGHLRRRCLCAYGTGAGQHPVGHLRAHQVQFSIHPLSPTPKGTHPSKDAAFRAAVALRNLPLKTLESIERFAFYRYLHQVPMVSSKRSFRCFGDGVARRSFSLWANHGSSYFIASPKPQ